MLLAHLLYIYFAVYYNDTLPFIIMILCQVLLYYFAVWHYANQLHIEEKEVVHSIILNFTSHPFMLTT